MRAPSEIESPWIDQKAVIHDRIGFEATDKYLRQLRSEIRKKKNTHVVREVRVGYVSDVASRYDLTSRFDRYTKTFIEDLIAKAGTEFEKLAAVGIAVAPHEFSVVEDSFGRFRTLARVAIIDGPSYGQRTPLDTIKHEVFGHRPPDAATTTLKTLICNYRSTARLADINTRKLSDFVYGAPRGDNAVIAPVPTYVDIEPLFDQPFTK